MSQAREDATRRRFDHPPSQNLNVERQRHEVYRAWQCMVSCTYCEAPAGQDCQVASGPNQGQPANTHWPRRQRVPPPSAFRAAGLVP